MLYEVITHFGIDEVFPNEKFDVIEFFECYKRAKEYAEQNNKNLIIVGGTGFYLKALIEGLSKGFDEDVELDIPLDEAYTLLSNIDTSYMEKIASNDRYRIEKAYSIYKQSGMAPSKYFELNPKKPIATDVEIFEIVWRNNFV